MAGWSNVTLVQGPAVSCCQSAWMNWLEQQAWFLEPTEMITGSAKNWTNEAGAASESPKW